MIQRKIHHVLKSVGQGKTFRYLRELNIPFDLNEPILVTEKVDGSTMQSKKGKPYKRFDLFRKGDPRKRTVPEKDRYELRELNREEPSNKWYLKSFDSQLANIEALGKDHPNIWIYFEAMGSKIGARYKELVPTIRAFDLSENGEFKHIAELALLCHQYNIPMVPHTAIPFQDLDNLLSTLEKATSLDTELPAHNLEGWVLRQNDLISKIRIKDLKKIKS